MYESCGFLFGDVYAQAGVFHPPRQKWEDIRRSKPIGHELNNAHMWGHEIMRIQNPVLSTMALLGDSRGFERRGVCG
jgi:hypothetical protein